MDWCGVYVVVCVVWRLVMSIVEIIVFVFGCVGVCVLMIEFGLFYVCFVVFDVFDVDIVFGEFVCVFGLFGCGKLMLFGVFVGYVVVMYGEIVVDGELVDCLYFDCGFVF